MRQRTKDEPVAEVPAEDARGEQEKSQEHRRLKMEARRRALVERGEAHAEEPAPVHEEKR